LQDSISAIEGQIGLRFKYALLLYNNALLPEELSLVQIGVVDGSTLNLEVKTELFGPNETSAAGGYRPADTANGLSLQMTQTDCASLRSSSTAEKFFF